ncbi:MAG: hypothetical protein ACLSAF_04440 [Intestinimonas sp.]
MEGRIYEECLARLERESAGQRRSIVLAGEGWHQGVVGIVASRLAEKYACPTFMICVQDGRGKGSCRSFGELQPLPGAGILRRPAGGLRRPCPGRRLYDPGGAHRRLPAADRPLRGGVDRRARAGVRPGGGR